MSILRFDLSGTSLDFDTNKETPINYVTRLQEISNDGKITKK
jgi:hypothetical protein